MYELRNNGGRAIEVRNVSLAEHTQGLRLLGVRAQTGGAPLGGEWPGYPPAKTESVPAGKFVLPAHGDATLLVGLQADQIGDYTLMGVEVEYRVRYVNGLGPRYRRKVTTTMAVCTQRRPVKARTELCNPPEIPT
jgi:hypothetical protein